MAMITADDASKLCFEQCRAVYREVLSKVYREKRPKADLDKLLEDDSFRYESLPATVAEAAEISKDQLARLVQWKITHGVNRPFLPSMVQKNADAEVQEQTKTAVKELRLTWKEDDKTITEAIMTALDHVCKLKGVGPATGSLLLSVMNPNIVPFFEDELFAWFCPDYTKKLKYDKKEYRLLLDRAFELMREQKISSADLEQTAFVLMNAHHLTKEQKEQILSSNKSEVSQVKSGKDSSVQRASEPPKESKGDSAPSRNRNDGKASESKAVRQAEPVVGERRSKRRKTEDQNG